eukprot:PhM_4_TR18706/c0_g1_i1/m.75544/K14573/NOP4, RBM28; nucleolar protein 4
MAKFSKKENTKKPRTGGAKKKTKKKQMKTKAASWVKALARKEKSDEVVRTTRANVSRDRVKARMDQKYPQERCVFLRSLPHDLTEEDVTQYLKPYGLVQRVLFVKNKTTEMPTGTAFVYFRSETAAQAAMQHAQEHAMDSSKASTKDQGKDTANSLISARNVKRQVFRKTTTVASGEATERPFLLFGSHKVEVLPPMKPGAAAAGSNDATGKPAGETRDARNLYLLTEGFFDATSPAAEDVTPAQIAERAALLESKCKRLKNPNFHVSRTRLCVHGLPVEYDEQMLNKLYGPYGKLRQVKLMRDATNHFESKGYAFVEFYQHEHALAALRGTNNNPTIFGRKRRPIVEFAIDNIRVVQKRMRRTDELTGTPAGDDADKTKKDVVPKKKRTDDDDDDDDFEDEAEYDDGDEGELANDDEIDGIEPEFDDDNDDDDEE